MVLLRDLSANGHEFLHEKLAAASRCILELRVGQIDVSAAAKQGLKRAFRLDHQAVIQVFRRELPLGERFLTNSTECAARAVRYFDPCKVACPLQRCVRRGGHRSFCANEQATI
eukprot:2232919-Pleurochrysis_carterae.AAC.5